MPFARSGANVHLLATETGLYRLIVPGGETSIAVNTPLLPLQRMDLTAPETSSVEPEPRQQGGSDLWRWLVLLGVLAFWLEWWLYYSSRENRRTMEMREVRVSGKLHDEDQELDRAEEQSEARKPNFVA